jgi:hypothetical protein
LNRRDAETQRRIREEGLATKNTKGTKTDKKEGEMDWDKD